MATSTFTGTLNNYGTTYGWDNDGITAQGNYGYGTRTGVIYFAGLTALAGKVINSVKIKVTSSPSGANASKTAYFYESASQGGIDTSLQANHKTGSFFATITGKFYNTTLEFSVSAFVSKIKDGQDTFCIYAGTTSTNYLKWSRVVLTVDWSEPTSTFTANSNMTMNNDYNVVISNDNSDYTHTVRMICGSDNQTFYTKTTSRTVSITPKLAFASQVPSATSVSATLYVDTYNGSTLIGTTSKSVKLYVPNSVVPNISAFTATLVKGFSGQYIQGKSKTTLATTASGSYGSTISKYSTVCSALGFSASTASATTNTLTTAGTFTFTATVTDTRGRTASTTVSITVIEYKSPTISSSSYAKRESDESETVKIKGISTWYAVAGNSLTMTYTIDNGTAIALSNSTEITLTGFSVEQSFTIKISVKDSITTTAISKSFNIPSLEYLIDYLGTGNGIAMGGVASKEGVFDCFYDAEFRGSCKVNDNAVVTSLVSSKYIYNRSVEVAMTNGKQYKIIATRTAVAGAFEKLVNYYNNTAIINDITSTTTTITVTADDETGILTVTSLYGALITVIEL